MIPADELTPKGTDVGVNIYIDRALAGAWGKGDRLYMQGPWNIGMPSQGYQLPLTPAQLKKLYKDKKDYQAKVRQRYDELAKQGWALPLPMLRDVVLNDALKVEF